MNTSTALTISFIAHSVLLIWYIRKVRNLLETIEVDLDNHKWLMNQLSLLFPTMNTLIFRTRNICDELERKEEAENA